MVVWVVIVCVCVDDEERESQAGRAGRCGRGMWSTAGVSRV